MGGKRGGEKWRWDRTGTPEVGLGEGRVFHAQRDPLTARGSVGTERDLQGIGRSEGKVANVSPGCSGPGKPAGVLGLNPQPPEPPPAAQVLALSPASTKASSDHEGPGSPRAAPDRASSGCTGPGRMSTVPLQVLLQLYRPLRACLWRPVPQLVCVGTCALGQLQEQTLVRGKHSKVGPMQQVQRPT